MISTQVPELNVQNGVLKALSFLFEYIGEMGKDYIYAVTPLLQDALMDRDLVHRQTAASVVQHMSLGVQVRDGQHPPPSFKSRSFNELRMECVWDVCSALTGTHHFPLRVLGVRMRSCIF